MTDYIQVFNDKNCLQINSKYTPMFLTRSGRLSSANAVTNSDNTHAAIILPLQDNEYNAAFRWIGDGEVEFTAMTREDGGDRMVGIVIPSGDITIFDNIEYYIFGNTEIPPMTTGDAGFEIYDENGGIVANSKMKVAKIIYAKTGLATDPALIDENESFFVIPYYYNENLFRLWVTDESDMEYPEPPHRFGYRYDPIAVMLNLTPHMNFTSYEGTRRRTATVKIDNGTISKITRSWRPDFPMGNMDDFNVVAGYFGVNLSYSVLYLDVSAYPVTPPPQTIKRWIYENTDIQDTWVVPYNGTYFIDGQTDETYTLTAGEMFNIELTREDNLLRFKVINASTDELLREITRDITERKIFYIRGETS